MISEYGRVVKSSVYIYSVYCLETSLQNSGMYTTENLQFTKIMYTEANTHCYTVQSVFSGCFLVSALFNMSLN